MISVREVEETEEEEEEVWMDLTEMSQVFEEHEFSFEPVDGDKIEFHNERKIYQAEMSLNANTVLQANKQTTEHLLR